MCYLVIVSYIKFVFYDYVQRAILKIKDLENDSYYSSNIYYQISVGEDYSFNIEGLSDEKKRKYIYVIFYLMLVNHQYVSSTVLKNYLDIEITKSSFKRLVDSLKEIVGFDIYINKYQSYVIENN